MPKANFNFVTFCEVNTAENQTAKENQKQVS